MPKRELSAHDRGMRVAFHMLLQLERSNSLSRECDPGADEASYLRPMRNLVFERVSAIAANREKLAGFCEVLTGYLAINSGGSVAEAASLMEDFAGRRAAQAKVSAARSDGRFQRFVETCAGTG